MLPLTPHLGAILPIQEVLEENTQIMCNCLLILLRACYCCPQPKDTYHQPVKEMFTSFKNKNKQQHTHSSAREMTQRAETHAPKPEDLSLLLRPHMAEGTICCKLSSDSIQTLRDVWITAQARTHKHTHTRIIKKFFSRTVVAYFFN